MLTPYAICLETSYKLLGVVFSLVLKVLFYLSESKSYYIKFFKLIFIFGFISSWHGVSLHVRSTSDWTCSGIISPIFISLNSFLFLKIWKLSTLEWKETLERTNDKFYGFCIYEPSMLRSVIKSGVYV